MGAASTSQTTETNSSSNRKDKNKPLKLRWSIVQDDGTIDRWASEFSRLKNPRQVILPLTLNYQPANLPNYQIPLRSARESSDRSFIACTD
jgi:hypothetical protein